MNNYLFTKQKITIVDFNDRNNCKVKNFYYLFGILVFVSRTRMATIREIESAVSNEKI